MTDHVLIAYGSKHSSTAETAERIGEMLRMHGLEVDVIEAKRVKSLEGYGPIVIGRCIHMSHLHPDVVSFRKRFSAELATRRVAYFAMGPIRPKELHFPFSLIPATDARDWDAIRSFADAFASRVSWSSPVAAA